MYNTKVLPIDYLGNLVMNMSGIASPVDANPFKDWTVIAFPYATGDFHAGTGYADAGTAFIGDYAEILHNLNWQDVKKND